MNKLIVLLLSGLIIYSCNSPQKKTELSILDYAYPDRSITTDISKKDFEVQEVKEIRQIPLEIIMMNKEVDVLTKDGYLIVKTLSKYNGAKMINIFSEDGSKHIKGLAPYGEGPNEFIDLRIISTNEKGTLCYILSLHNNKIYVLRNNLSLEYISTFPTPKNVKNFRARYHDLFHLYGDEFFCQQRAQDGLGLCKINVNDSTVTGLVGLNFSESLNSFWQIYTGHAAYNSKKNRIVYAMGYFDRILLFDAEGNHLKVVQCGSPRNLVSKNRSELYETGEEVTYYKGIFANENFIYILYKGEKAYSPDFDKNGHYYIEKYDWEGNPIKRYKLPKGMRFNGGCTTSEKDVFYLICSHEDEFLYRVILD